MRVYGDGRWLEVGDDEELEKCDYGTGWVRMKRVQMDDTCMVPSESMQIAIGLRYKLKNL